VLGHVGVHAGGDVVIDSADGRDLHALVTHDGDRPVREDLGV
jgi:hypothetical protein